MSVVPPQSELNGEDYLLRWERFPPAVPTSEQIVYYKQALVLDSGDVENNDNGRALYTRPAADACSGREIFFQFRRYQHGSFHLADGTSRIEYYFNLFLVPDPSRTTAQFQRIQNSWNIHHATAGGYITDETDTNKLRNFGMYKWAGNSYDAQLFLLSGTTGRVQYNVTKSMSQSHYDKSYEHESNVGDNAHVLMLYSGVGPVDGTAITKNTGFLKVGNNANHSVFTYYDITGKYPPYFKIVHNGNDNFSPVWNADGNRIRTGSLSNCVSDFACQLDTKNQSKRLFLKTSIPQVNGLIITADLELYILSSSDVNRILTVDIRISDNTSWTEGTATNTMLQNMRDDTSSTSLLYLSQRTVIINDTSPINYIPVAGLPFRDQASYWNPTYKTIKGLDYLAYINGATQGTIIIEDVKRWETGTGILTSADYAYKLGQDVSSNPYTFPFSKKTFYYDQNNYSVTPTIHYRYLPPKMHLDTTTFNITTVTGTSPASSTIILKQVGWGSLVASISSNQSWATPSPTTSNSLIRVDPATYQTQNIAINYSTNALSVGNYTSTITFFDADSDITSLTATINLTVTADPYLQMDTTSPTFEEIFAGDNASSVTVRVWDLNDNTSDKVKYNVTSGDAWVSLITDTTGESNSSSNKITHTIDFDTYSLPVGNYETTITATDISGNGTQNVVFNMSIINQETGGLGVSYCSHMI